MKYLTLNIFTLVLSVTVTSQQFGGVLVEVNTESPAELFQEELGNAIEIYKNFSDAVFATISDIGENTTDSETEAVDDGGSVASLLGISYILASTSEHVWPLSFPIFDSIMGNLNWNVLEAFDTVLLQMKQTIDFVTVMFVPLSHNTTTKGKNLIEFIAVDFEEDDATVPVINDKILSSTNGLIQSNYIQDGVLIPSSTRAIFVNVVQTKLRWTTPLLPIGKRAFNKNEQGEMLQFQGEVRMTEKDSEVEVFILFENKKNGIGFRIPKDISKDRSVANIEELSLTNPRNATIQIPWMNYTLRSKYNLNDENLGSCDFQKEENVLQILDVLTYIFLGPDYFHVVSVSGAQVINVEQFQEEIRQQSDVFNKTINFQETPVYRSDSKPSTEYDSKSYNDENMEDVDFEYLEVEEIPQVKDYDSAEKRKSSMENDEKVGITIDTEEAVPKHSKNETLIIFDRPFTWMLFDEHQVPIVAGIVTSLKSPVEEAPPAFSFLGMDSWKNVPYFQCF